MSDTQVVHIGLQALMLAAKLAGPALVTTLAIGLLVGLFQSVTQLQEPTLTFVPKFAGVALVLLVAGGWMMREAVAFTRGMIDLLPSLIA